MIPVVHEVRVAKLGEIRVTDANSATGKAPRVDERGHEGTMQRNAASAARK
jgi:hypothetical protein